MTNDKKIALSRRQVLGSIGAVGLASAGAGLGTSALFNDEETFEDNRIMAGSLDLKVGWEEHYSFPQLYDFDDPADGLDVTRSDPGSDSYVGLPDPSSPVVWVHEDDLAAYMSNTAIEAFPDPDDDGEQEMKTESFRYAPCEDGADTPSDLDPDGSGVTRTDKPYITSDGDPEPIVSLDDVKPGDFGEFTFSYHLCGNPGYVGLKAANVTESGGTTTEPEPTPDEGELAENIRTAWWYDNGDNVLSRDNCEEDTLYLEDHTTSGSDSTTRLYEVSLDAGAMEATTTELVRFGGDLKQAHIGASLDGKTVYAVSEHEPKLAVVDVPNESYEIKTIDLNGMGPYNSITQVSVAPDGTLCVSSDTEHALFEIADPSTSPTVFDRVELDMAIQGADNVFASNGQFFFYKWSSGELYTVDLLSGTTSKVGTLGIPLTGLAIRSGGTADFIGSRSKSKKLETFDADGTAQETFTLKGDLIDDRGQHTFGDLANRDFCERRIDGLGGTLKDDLDALENDPVVLKPLADPSDPCFQPGFTRYIGFAWWIPDDVGNEIQGDSLSFDLVFETEQCRNNDDPL